MKRIILPFLFAAICGCADRKDVGAVSGDSVTVNATADGEAGEDMPEIRFDEESYDFGKITQGERVSHDFTFENTGERELIISGAQGSCGCTVPEWPREPIPPGGKGRVNVVFNSEGKSGYQEKTISIITNAEPATRIVRIKAEVVVPESQNQS